MKFLKYILLILFVYSCKDNPQQAVITPKDCPLPVQLTDPNASPISMHYAAKLSPDGSKLFFSVNLFTVKILDLKTLNVTEFDIRPLLPKNIKFGDLGPIIHWCPYDNNRFVCVPHYGIDTIGDGKKFPGGYHIFICSIDGSSYEDITPKIFNAIGSRTPLPVYSWSYNSNKGNDWFLIGYRLEDNGKHYYGLYNPKTQELKEQEDKGLTSFSIDGKFNYYINYDSSYKLRYYINNNELVFKDIDYASTSYASFSPDGKHFAIAANVYDKTRAIDSTDRLSEVWIVDVEKFMQNPVQPVPVKIINVKDNFCMFSFGLHPVFTSNNTLAVSMFKAGDTFSYLHEIDLDGNYIRQLTFLP